MSVTYRIGGEEKRAFFAGEERHGGGYEGGWRLMAGCEIYKWCGYNRMVLRDWSVLRVAYSRSPTPNVE